MSQSAVEINSTARSDSVRADWCYVSGRVTVMEADLLGRGFFEALLACKSVEDAQSTFAKTRYRTALATSEQTRAYDETLAAYNDSVTADIWAVSPPHILKNFLQLRKNYGAFRNVFLRDSQMNASPEELDEAFNLLATTPAEALALEPHMAMLRQAEPPQAADAVGRSIYLDSAVCTLALALASLAHEEAVAQVLRDRALLQCWSAVVRSRLNGTPPEVIEKWFLVPEQHEGLVRDTTRLADGNAAGAILGLLSEAAAEELRETGAERIRENVDAVAEDAIFPNTLACRSEPFGPEKVLAYMIAFGVEQENLRVCLASVVHGVERQAAAQALRREYA